MNDHRTEMQELQRLADRVCVLILSSDLPAIDIEIEIEKNKDRERCLELFPDQEQLYEMIYESRFQRLWEQFEGERTVDSESGVVESNPKKRTSGPAVIISRELS